jgi:hypothetical protein
MKEISSIFLLLLISLNPLQAQWTPTQGIYGGVYITCFGVCDSVLFAALGRGPTFSSTDNGASWEPVLGLDEVYTFAVSDRGAGGRDLFAGTRFGVYLSTDNGTNWTFLAGGLTFNYVTSLVAIDSSIFAGTMYGGIFRSTNNGATWTSTSSGLPSDVEIRALLAKPNGVGGLNLFAAAMRNGIFLSTNYGSSWVAVNSGLSNATIQTLVAGIENSQAAALFAGSNDQGVFVSTDNGSTWIASNVGLTNPTVLSLCVGSNGRGGTNLFAGTAFGGAFLSTDNGAHWREMNTGLTNPYVQALTISINDGNVTNLFAGTGGGGVFRSTNNGLSWRPANAGLPCSVNALAVSGSNILAGNLGGGMFISSNSGITWIEINNGLAFPYVHAVAVAPDHSVFVGTRRGVFLSTNDGANWNQCDTNFTEHVQCLALSPHGTSGVTIIAGTDEHGVFRSTNNGLSWEQSNSGLTQSFVLSLVACPAEQSTMNVFAGTYTGGVFLSTDDGTTWMQTGLTSATIWALIGFANRSGTTDIVAGTNSGAFVSMNNGTSWLQTGLSHGIFSLASSHRVGGGTCLFAGTSGGWGVFLSSDDGSSWIAVDTGLPPSTITSLAASDSFLFAGTGFGVWRRPLSEMITSIQQISDELPNGLRLEQSFPNPFNSATRIRFQIPGREEGGLTSRSLAVLKVFDMLGREVATLVNEEMIPGTHETTFYGTALASGVYVYRLRFGNFVETKKLVLMK